MSVLTEGTLMYKALYNNGTYYVHIDEKIINTFIQVPSPNLSAAFIAWNPTYSSVSLTKDSAESIRKIKAKCLVDLSITVDHRDLVSFKRQSIFETFCFPSTSRYSSIMRITCKVYEDNLESTFENRCLSDLAKMLTEEKLADVTLLCHGGSLKAHKNILAARSEVFDKMFQSNMLEAQKGEVECKFDVSTMKALLEFMYFGKFDQSNVINLLKAADYYGILQLKEACFDILAQDSILSLRSLLF